MKISRSKIELLQVMQGMNGKQLADAAGISRQNLSTVKTRGTCAPETVLKLSRALGVDVTEIMEVEQ